MFQYQLQVKYHEYRPMLCTQGFSSGDSIFTIDVSTGERIVSHIISLPCRNPGQDRSSVYHVCLWTRQQTPRRGVTIKTLLCSKTISVERTLHNRKAPVVQLPLQTYVILGIACIIAKSTIRGSFGHDLKTMVVTGVGTLKNYHCSTAFVSAPSMQVKMKLQLLMNH